MLTVMNWSRILFALLVGAAAWWPPAFASPSGCDGWRMVDAHSHYSAADARAFSPESIVARLDAACVARIVVSGTPAEHALALHAHAPERVIPFLGVYANAAGKALWMHDETLPERVRARLDDGPWRGIGELHLFARDARSEVFEALVVLAVEHDLVLMIHGDAAVVDRAFEIAPAVRVLWAHLGTFPVPALLDRVLRDHADKALWIDTSVRDERIAPEGVLLAEWRDLFERHPQRFVVAVDAFSVNRWGRYGEVVERIRGWTDDLPEALAANLLWRNAETLFGPSRDPE